MRLFLVSYDVADDKRRARIAAVLSGYGQRLQFSVFVVLASATQHARLRGELQDALDADSDQVLLVDLGPADGRGSESVESLGLPVSLPDRRAIIV
ncbi:MAG: CRISPR-associated endonuclease Cas2 [Deltaproteobacteria bacterium]|nr:CRISPR-associated endonuclease Cas2 [Deltaproteobacteria bacterium]